MSRQLFFDLDFTPPSRPRSASTGRRRQGLQRAVLRWLEATDPPTGLGVNVVTRISRLRADIGAFWSRPIRNTHDEGPSQILNPVRTAIVQCCAERDECWPDCTRSDELLPKLRSLKEEIVAVEAQIRVEEPKLRATNTLFEEYAEWDYEGSGNRTYHRLKRAIAKMEHAVYHGTKFERIRSVALADLLYLAVPEGTVQPGELADGWGLLWVDEQLGVEQVAAPNDRECLPSNRLHLIQNIAASSQAVVSASCGVRWQSGGDVVFVRKPKSHRQITHPTLSD